MFRLCRRYKRLGEETNEKFWFYFGQGKSLCISKMSTLGLRVLPVSHSETVVKNIPDCTVAAGRESTLTFTQF
jgi:hypothetical protein